MDFVVDYFTELKDLPLHRAFILFGGLTLLLVIEFGLPFFKTEYRKGAHIGLNLFFTVTTIVVNFLMAGILVFSSAWVAQHEFGVLQWSGLIEEGASYSQLAIAMVVGVLLMDLIGAWLAHFVEHKVKWLWQFHVVHHTDQNVDASTANRHHPGESVIRFIFTTVAVFLVGTPVWVIMLYQSLSVILSQFNHSNVAISERLDSALRWIICTPNMHRVHHHYRQPYSDMNFGNIFSFWDRIFGTYVEVDNRKLVYGVDTYMEKEKVTNIWYLLKIPFSGYRKPPEHEMVERL